VWDKIDESYKFIYSLFLQIVVVMFRGCERMCDILLTFD